MQRALLKLSMLMFLLLVTDPKTVSLLKTILQHSGKDLYQQVLTNGYGMNTDFERVPAINLNRFAVMFPSVSLDKVTSLTPVNPDYISALRNVVEGALKSLEIVDTVSAYTAYKNRFSYRWGMVASSRNEFVNKLRFLNRFERKVDRAAENIRLRNAQMQSKSRLAYRIDGEKLDDATLSYVAYLTARANRRSLFMFGSQSKAFDTLADALFLTIPDNAAWGEVALVRPTRSIFNRLSTAEVAELVGVYHKEMLSHAERLNELYNTLPSRMRKEMVMVQGVDSSRWNAYAGAFNTMRSAWVAATISAGMEEIFDSYLPGKAPRLMAADLVWGYRNSGSELHPDTAMFNALPYPWEVVQGKVELTREQIIAEAEKLNFKAYVETGWVAPRSPAELELPSVEPYTVHGVVVADPHLGSLLKKMNVFSGKNIKWDKLGNEELNFSREYFLTPNGGITPVVI